MSIGLTQRNKTLRTGVSGLIEQAYQTGDGVFAVDQDQRIIFWNEGAANILGFISDEVIGRYCFEVVRGISEAGQVNCGPDCPVLACGVKGAPVCSGYNLMVRSKYGSLRWLSMTHTFLKTLNECDAAVVHIFRDVTKEVEAKQLLEQIGEQIAGHLLSSPVQSTQSDVQCNEEGGRSAEAELTERERQVLELLAQGEATNEISKKLVISNTTTRNHIQNILAKLGVHNRLEAVAYALRHKIIEPGFLYDGDAPESMS